MYGNRGAQTPGGTNVALFLTEAEVAELLPMAAALEAVEAAIKAQGLGLAINEPRRRIRTPGGMLHVMSGAVLPAGLLGFKAYTTFRAGAKFLVMLYSADDGRLLAVMQADKLGQLRTGAASGVATKYLARPDASVLGVIGAGWQAESQVEAVCQVRPINLVRVYSRTPERRAEFAARMAERLGIRVEAVESALDAVKDADVVVTITTSRDPVLLGEWLRPGMHINAAGSNSLLRRELDDEAIKRADLIFVDSKDQARIESGDLLGPIERGLISWEAVYELGQVVAGLHPGRQSADQITLFESHGLAIWDVAAAGVVYERARERGVGREIDL